jgi:hypothetical protein
MYETRIMWYYGDKRAKKWREHDFNVTDDAIISCGGNDWKGKVSEADTSGPELRCPKCGNFIFIEYPYTFRIAKKV